MFEIDFGEEPAPDRRFAMDQFWIRALARLEDYIARESHANEPVADPSASRSSSNQGGPR